MINTRMMYLRPGNMFKEFVVDADEQIVTGTGRVANHHTGDGANILRGCLAEATDEERTNHSQKDHVVTHTIVQSGSPKAKSGDKLVLENRTFYIVNIDDVGSLGISTIYYAEERRDTK